MGMATYPPDALSVTEKPDAVDGLSNCIDGVTKRIMEVRMRVTNAANKLFGPSPERDSSDKVRPIASSTRERIEELETQISYLEDQITRFN